MSLRMPRLRAKLDANDDRLVSAMRGSLSSQQRDTVYRVVHGTPSGVTLP